MHYYKHSLSDEEANEGGYVSTEAAVKSAKKKKKPSSENN